jgi:chemotaxis protein MotB
VSTRIAERLNPYIATTDVVFSLVFVFVLMLVSATVIDAIGGTRLTHMERAHEVEAAVRHMDATVRPVLIPVSERNDPAGTQRWRFTGAQLFVAGTTDLTAQGREAVRAFGLVLVERSTWRRIRVEGHTRMTRPGELDDWERSAALAAAVVRELVLGAGIEPWYMGIAGRGGQAPVSPGVDAPRIDERIEIVIEYCVGDACAREKVGGM